MSNNYIVLDVMEIGEIKSTCHAGGTLFLSECFSKVMVHTLTLRTSQGDTVFWNQQIGTKAWRRNEEFHQEIVTHMFPRDALLASYSSTFGGFREAPRKTLLNGCWVEVEQHVGVAPNHPQASASNEMKYTQNNNHYTHVPISLSLSLFIAIPTFQLHWFKRAADPNQKSLNCKAQLCTCSSSCISLHVIWSVNMINSIDVT